MAFKMKGFKAHDMFNPKTGEKFRAKKLADHKRMDKMGYTHDSPKKKKGPCWKNYPWEKPAWAACRSLPCGSCPG